MKPRQLIILVLILAALVGAALWKKAADRKAVSSFTPAAAETALGEEIAPGFVTKVALERGGEKLVLVKEEASGRWTLASHHGARVRKEAVESFLGHLRLIRGEVRSESEAVLGDFALTDDKAVHIRLYGAGDKELAHILLSPQRPRGTLNFVRLSGSSRVVATSTDLLADLGIFSETDRLDHPVFSDLRPAGIDSSKVVSFELTPPGQKTMSFVRKEDGSGWTVDGAPAESAKVNEFFAGLYNLYANEPAAADTPGFGEPWVRLRFKAGESPDSLDILVAPPSDGLRALKTLPDGAVYRIPDSQLEPQLIKDKRSFLPAKTG